MSLTIVLNRYYRSKNSVDYEVHVQFLEAFEQTIHNMMLYYITNKNKHEEVDDYMIEMNEYVLILQHRVLLKKKDEKKNSI